ncbi:tRNA1(Val) (adenine(37)-N6)-methyltransferase [Shewanella marina]|uniref:tRNA1(Val) (adenine(37)-N6)-methyltransferase n=1 Tax=Shewanella marina TaxID=487319 RepID=UPI00046F6FD4|nr:methyltransferase [Shewanella marina]
MAFTFKQFHIDDYGCGMPVSTDGVLLGAWANLSQAQQILDIGAGSGLLSLMAAQRSSANITAVELDEVAALACQKNFQQSPWHSRLNIEHADINEFCQHYLASDSALFDHIICNPPYFENGPQSQKVERATARHTDNLSFGQLLSIMAKLLTANGTISVILPTQSLAAFTKQLEQNSLQIYAQVDVVSVIGKLPQRVLLALRQTEADNGQVMAPQTLNICVAGGQYSPEMIALTKAFYLKL